MKKLEISLTLCMKQCQNVIKNVKAEMIKNEYQMWRPDPSVDL